MTEPKIHSAKNFDPANYTYIGHVYIGTNEEADAALNDGWDEDVKAAWEALESSDKHRAITQEHRATSWACDHCGTEFKYGAVYQHSSGEVIFVGHICSNEAFGYNSKAEYNYARLQKRIQATKARLKLRAVAQAFLSERPSLKADFEYRGQHPIIADIESKLLQYGSLSEKQIAFVHRLVDQVKNREVEKKRREAEGKLSNHVGTVGERIEITATIVMIKSYEKAYSFNKWDTQGTITKLVDDNGNQFIYFNDIKTKELHAVDARMNTPSFEDTDKGDKVCFRAMVKEHSEYQGTKQTILKRASKAVLLARGINH